MDHKEIAWDGVDWMDFTHDRNMWQATVNRIMDVWAAQNLGDF
jgi:hypothetical protein